MFNFKTLLSFLSSNKTSISKKGKEQIKQELNSANEAFSALQSTISQSNDRLDRLELKIQEQQTTIYNVKKENSKKDSLL